MTKNIQMKYRNEAGEWVKLDPKTNSEIIQMTDGKSLETAMAEKALKANVYTKTETYNKTEVDGLVETMSDFKIIVSETEPADDNFWFEIL